MTEKKDVPLIEMLPEPAVEIQHEVAMIFS